MSIDMAQFHQVFFEESFEGLDVMESGLLNMDPGAVDGEEINGIFRAAHSIKGGSGTFGFAAVADFTHVMETLLDEMRSGRRPVTTGAVEVLLRSVDVLREMLTATRDGGGLDAARVRSQQQELERTLGQRAAAPETPAAAAEIRPLGWHIVFRPRPHLMRTGNDPLRLLQELAGLGDLEVSGDASALPSLSAMDPEECYLSWDLHLTGTVERAQVEEIFDWVEDDCDLAIMPLLPDGAQATEAAAEPRAACLPKAGAPAPAPKGSAELPRATGGSPVGGGAGSIRVDIHKIDTLINMVGELVITQSMLGLLGEDFDMSRLERLRVGLAQLERHTRELQESVMQIRMLPISFTFSRFPRLVHDLSRKLGKKVELKMTGEATEVDKTVIEKIGDPLVHLVRNSLDHGIEPPAERLAAGKPETGVVQLNAFHKGGNIMLEIRDDGRGLDREKLLAEGIERGLATAEQNVTDQQIYELIFMPGFSTADRVSDVSGRGVGMDVVRRNINELGGGIEIASQLGRGSAILIRLPLTLAILDGQSIAVGGETYIVPLVSIVESIQIRKEMVNRVAGRGETFRLREDYLPIVRLHQVFGVQNAKANRLQDGLLVVVEGEGRRCGLFVDDLLGQQQVVIKSLEANYLRVEGISGATILGDGSVALILDVPGLLRLANRPPKRNG
jgi:two-component system chemotaxis sensor kinase CheA